MVNIAIVDDNKAFLQEMKQNIENISCRLPRSRTLKIMVLGLQTCGIPRKNTEGCFI